MKLRKDAYGVGPENDPATKQYKEALLSMDGTLPHGYTLSKSEGGSSCEILDDEFFMAGTQLLPNGSMRFSARADCFEMLPCTSDHPDWDVVCRGEKLFIVSKIYATKELEIPHDAIIRFTTGEVNPNPFDENGKEYPLHPKKGKKAPPPKQESPNAQGSGSDGKEGKEGKEGGEKAEQTDGDKLADAQAAQGQSEGQDEGQEGNGDGEPPEPPPVESDELPEEQEQKEGDGKGGGKPPPPPPQWRVGEAVIMSPVESDGILDKSTGESCKSQRAICTVLSATPQQAVLQRWDNGRYIVTPWTKVVLSGVPDCPYVTSPIQQSKANPAMVNIKDCCYGYRFIAVGETIPTGSNTVAISAPLGGDKADILVRERRWHFYTFNVHGGMVFANEDGTGIYPFSYYKVKCSGVFLPPKDSIEIGGWKLTVEEWTKKEPELVRESAITSTSISSTT